MNLITLSAVKENHYDFELEIEGIDNLESLKVRLCIDIKGIHYCFPATRQENSKFAVTVPPLEHIERTAYPYKIEAIADGYFFEVASGTANIVKDPFIKVKDGSKQATSKPTEEPKTEEKKKEEPKKEVKVTHEDEEKKKKKQNFDFIKKAEGKKEDKPKEEKKEEPKAEEKKDDEKETTSKKKGKKASKKPIKEATKPVLSQEEIEKIAEEVIEEAKQPTKDDSKIKDAIRSIKEAPITITPHISSRKPSTATGVPQIKKIDLSKDKAVVEEKKEESKTAPVSEKDEKLRAILKEDHDKHHEQQVAKSNVQIRKI